MITCILKGGLCNQLFQIFATIAYCIKFNHNFFFVYNNFTQGITIRKTYWENFLITLKNFTTKNERLNLTNEVIEKFQPLYYNQHHYIEIANVGQNVNAKLDGYFQSYRYFDEYENTIFSLIRLDKQLQKVKNEYIHFFEDNGKKYYTISMHFRLGDYKHLQKSHNILPYEYYERSLEMILRNIEKKNVRILYFCEEEDNEYVSHVITRLNIYINSLILDRIENFTFLKVYDSIEDWKQLLLMACCDSNIIANSSFSWWGAYFNRNNDKQVYYPSVWFGPASRKNYLGDMFPDSWNKINI